MSKRTKTLLEAMAMNIAIALFVIIFYSPGLLNLRLDYYNPLRMLAFIFCTITIAGCFVYGNYLLFVHKDSVRVIHKDDVSTLADIESLLRDVDPKCFRKNITEALSQISRMQAKIDTANDLLTQYFNPTELSCKHYLQVVSGITAYFISNVRNMINRINIFDFYDYTHLKDAGKNIPSAYGDHINYVEDMIVFNDDVLVKMDNLLLELSKLNDADSSTDLLAMAELEQLIQNTKFYKQ